MVHLHNLAPLHGTNVSLRSSPHQSRDSSVHWCTSLGVDTSSFAPPQRYVMLNASQPSTRPFLTGRSHAVHCVPCFARSVWLQSASFIAPRGTLSYVLSASISARIPRSGYPALRTSGGRDHFATVCRCRALLSVISVSWNGPATLLCVQPAICEPPLVAIESSLAYYILTLDHIG